MGNEKRSTSQSGEGRRKKAKSLRPAGPSISDRDKHQYLGDPSTCDEPLSYHPNSESAGQLAAPAAAAHSQISPSTPAPTTVSSRHEEYYTTPQATYRGDRSSVSDYAHDAYVSAAEEVFDPATLNRVSMTATQGSVYGSRHNSRDMADWNTAQARPLSLSRISEFLIEGQLWDPVNGYSAASTQSLPPFSTFTTSSERTRARNSRHRLVQRADILMTGNLTPPPDTSLYQQTLEVEDHDIDIQFPDITGYPHRKGF
ncbi:hypothetical protein RB599_002235 [Gaeumannomyces hyphopodioides]